MLNTTGSYIWQGLQRGESISSIAGSLALTTGESSLAVMRDVEDFVDELKHRGLISE
ncbi:PqqD family protein [Edaphobacter flagellatus]|uniref:PqqD family protein n=1 Tax=Edaphobacter flagellatus TaxID=1933044 RepID=UPI0036F2E11F